MAIGDDMRADSTTGSPAGGTQSSDYGMGGLLPAPISEGSGSIFVFYDQAPRGTPATPPYNGTGGTGPDYSYGHSTGTGGVVTGIPEPATMLFGLTLCAFALAHRRR